jgi:hypothetical protein
MALAKLSKTKKIDFKSKKKKVMLVTVRESFTKNLFHQARVNDEYYVQVLSSLFQSSRRVRPQFQETGSCFLCMTMRDLILQYQ